MPGGVFPREEAVGAAAQRRERHADEPGGRPAGFSGALTAVVPGFGVSVGQDSAEVRRLSLGGEGGTGQGGAARRACQGLRKEPREPGRDAKGA